MAFWALRSFAPVRTRLGGRQFAQGGAVRHPAFEHHTRPTPRRTATTTPVRQVTGLGLAYDLPAASAPPSPSFTDCAALLRRAQAAADRVEGSVGDLDGTLCE